MSDGNTVKEIKSTGIFEQLKQQYAAFCSQRDQANINLQQLVGAIYACEVMIKKHEEDLKAISHENLGNQGSDQVDESGFAIDAIGC